MICFSILFYEGYQGSHLACTKPVVEVSTNETFVVGCKARSEVFSLYYCKITIILKNGKEISCAMYTDKNNGYQLTPYDGLYLRTSYCEQTLIKKYVKQIGNAPKGGCGFEIDAAKTNIGQKNYSAQK